MSGARVQSTESLLQVRAALIQFAERSQGALASLRQETRQTLRWLQDEQPQYWQMELRRSFDRVASCRVSYETCRMRTIAGHRSACIEEKVALQRAQRRLEYVQEQINVTRRWGIQAADQANEFFGKIGPLERSLDYEIPAMLAALERMLSAIEAYAGNDADSEATEPTPAKAAVPDTLTPLEDVTAEPASPATEADE